MSTPYERIVRAADRGTGCRLSAEDCAALADDTAISQRAEMDRDRECESVWHDTPEYDRRARVCPECGKRSSGLFNEHTQGTKKKG